MNKGQRRRLLHILRRKDDAYAWEIAGLQARQPDTEVIVLLLHDAVFSAPPAESTGMAGPSSLGAPGTENGLPNEPDIFTVKVFACRDDLLARGLEGRFPALDYPEIVQLVFECDSVHTW